MVSDNLVKDFVEADCDVPVGIVRLELPQVRNVADVVADAVLIDICPAHLLAGDLLNLGDGF